jgi:hypothetical protein
LAELAVDWLLTASVNSTMRRSFHVDAHRRCLSGSYKIGPATGSLYGIAAALAIHQAASHQSELY